MNELKWSLLAFLLAALAIGVLIGVDWKRRARYRADLGNPYRRYCLSCGQQQDRFTMCGDGRLGWWENIGAIHDSGCACQDDAESR